MDFENFIKLILAGGSLTLGAFLTAVRSQLNSSKKRSSLHIIFYIVSGIVISSTLICVYKNWNDLNTFGIIVLILADLSSIALIWFTKKYLAGKNHYTTKSLNPIVNKFTANADKNNIKLLAGDINFFGNTPLEMNSNSQYNCLLETSFRRIQILCFEPQNNIEKIRYGKILSDLNGVEFKYYHPQEADLLIRGRMKTLNNVTHLLIYNKISSGIYEALETDTANSNGALYNHTWNLLWRVSKEPTQAQLSEYRQLYSN